MTAVKSFACVRCHEANDCGPAVLASIARHYGLHLGLLQARELLGTDLQGSDLSGISKAAEQLGFVAQCGKIKLADIDQIPLPAIIHYSDTDVGHFVVLYSINSVSATVADPERGVLETARSVFLQRWSQFVVLLRPGPDFRPSTKRDSAFGRLVAIAMRERRVLLTAVLLTLTTAVLGFGTSIFLELALDHFIPESDFRLLYTLGAGAIVIVVFFALSRLSREYLLASLGYRLENEFGLKAVAQVLRLPINFFERRSAGDILGRIADVGSVRRAVVGSLLSVFMDTLVLIFAALYLAGENALLTCTVFACTPLFIMAILMSYKRLRQCDREIRERYALFSDSLIETIANIRVLKAFTAESIFYERLASYYRTAQDAVLRRIRLSQLLDAVSVSLIGTASVALLVVGARLVIERQITTGKLMFFYSLVGVFLGSLQSFSPSIGSLQEGLVAIERINDLSSLPPERPTIESTHKSPQTCRQVELKGVGYWRRENQPILANISFSLKLGDVVAVVGETGAGKTTLACVLAGLYEAKEGMVLVDGADTRTMPTNILRRNTAIVFQEGGLLSGTIGDNILMAAPDAGVDLFDRIVKLAHVNDFVKALPNQYKYNVGVYGSGLSSGQRQRVSIARALLRQAPILILDEATSHLDAVTEQMIIDDMLETRNDRITVIITHRIATAQRADKIIVLSGGSIVEQGTHDYLLDRRGTYHLMWTASAARANAIDPGFLNAVAGTDP